MAGINRAAIFTAASLVAALLPLVTVQVLLNVDDLSDSMFLWLILLGNGCTIAVIILGLFGMAAAAGGSGLRHLSTFAVVLGVIELVAVLAFTMFALALREASSSWW